MPSRCSRSEVWPNIVVDQCESLCLACRPVFDSPMGSVEKDSGLRRPRTVAASHSRAHELGGSMVWLVVEGNLLCPYSILGFTSSGEWPLFFERKLSPSYMAWRTSNEKSLLGNMQDDCVLDFMVNVLRIAVGWTPLCSVVSSPLSGVHFFSFQRNVTLNLSANNAQF